MHVTRQRAAKVRLGLFGRHVHRRTAAMTVGATALVLAGSGFAAASTDIFGNHHVGENAANGVLLPSDQTYSGVGSRLLVDDGKLIASTVSPDGHHLAALTTDRAIALTVVDLDTYKVIQQAGTAANATLKIKRNDVGQEGPTYSPDGKFLWMPGITGFQRFPVNADGTLAAPTQITLPAQGSKQPLPTQAVFSADGTTLYVALNGQNTVAALDPTTGSIKQTWNVGNAPRDLALVGTHLYVSNEGGRPAQAGDPTLNSYFTNVVADQVTGATTTGTVSDIDVSNANSAVGTIPVGLHPTAMEAKNGALFVTDTNSDDVSVIDTRTDQVVQTITTRPWASASVGYGPNGVTLTDDGHLLVTLGRANAVAVYTYTTPQAPVSYVGLLPTDYFPTDVTTVNGQVLVTNLRGIGERGPTRTIAKGPGTTPATGHNTHDSTGTFLRFPLPDDATIAASTPTVFAQNGWDDRSLVRASGARPAPVAVPVRLGDPSKIKHVFLIVKENRSYDQVFGDDPRGNGDPTLAQFGENVTPNQHALARQFGLYDNTYDVGTNSAEGHNWLMQSDDPEYTESTAGEYTRTYDTENDALGHQRSGFIWNAVQATGKSARDFGEFNFFHTVPSGASWQNYYCDAKNMETGADPTLLQYTSSPIPSLNQITVHQFPMFDTSIPDIYRYEIWKRDFEQNGPANLNMFWLSSDHTGGPPSPVAQVADNDLAVGKMVDTISHSKYWKDSAIFVIEDDTQDGVDHVDGARGPVQIISPFAQHGVVDSHYYTQITVMRTIEQILGAQPMNQKDSAATPMFSAFTNKADKTPYTYVPNRIPLTYGLATPPPCGNDTVPAQYDDLTPHIANPQNVPAGKEHVADLWREWRQQQHLTGKNAIPDYANPEQMDHYTWYLTHGWKVPYPGEDQVLTPLEVPGAYLPPSDTE